MSSELITLQGKQVSLIDIRRNEGNQFPRLKTYSWTDAMDKMTKVVLNAFLYKGQNADPDNIQFIASNLLKELLGHPGGRNITFQEIAYCIKKAILEDDTIGISVVTLYKAVIKYIDGEGKAAHEKAKMQQDARNRYQLGVEIEKRLRQAATKFTKEHQTK